MPELIRLVVRERRPRTRGQPSSRPRTSTHWRRGPSTCGPGRTMRPVKAGTVRCSLRATRNAGPPGPNEKREQRQFATAAPSSISALHLRSESKSPVEFGVGSAKMSEPGWSWSGGRPPNLSRVVLLCRMPISMLCWTDGRDERGVDRGSRPGLVLRRHNRRDWVPAVEAVQGNCRRNHPGDQDHADQGQLRHSSPFRLAPLLVRWPV